MKTDHLLQPTEALRSILDRPAGSIICLGNIGGSVLQDIVDQTDIDLHGRRVFFMRLRPRDSISAHIEQVLQVMAEAALHLWPVWFTDVNFAMCTNDTLGRHAAGAIAREAASRIQGLLVPWTEAAASHVLAGKSPRVLGVPPGIEIAQLSLAISRGGLVMVADLSAAAELANTVALPSALEWVVQHSVATLIALFRDLPPLGSSFDRILYNSQRVVFPSEYCETFQDDAPPHTPESWIAPWHGEPHPLSVVEQRLAANLRADIELADLFRFNWLINTVRGSRPKVDMVWIEGRLVVELDGYPDHSTRRAFVDDRQRDYELSLSGYTVLRIPNEEILQDFARAVEKIRDLVRLRRSQLNMEI